jgi:hypothetical protein
MRLAGYIENRKDFGSHNIYALYILNHNDHYGHDDFNESVVIVVSVVV